MSTVVLLTEPRTGSTWLTSIFYAHGYGAPGFGSSWEIFDPYYHPLPQFREWARGVEEMRNRVEGFRQQGKLVVKVMYDQLQDMLAYLGRGMEDAPSFLARVFPDARFIRLHRRDPAAQAVSLYVARTTDTYHFTPEPVSPPYDYLSILAFLHVSQDAEESLRFCEPLRPLHIVYEDLLENPEASSRLISEHISFPIHVAAPTAIRQEMHDQKKSYAERFRRELGDRIGQHL